MRWKHNRKGNFNQLKHKGTKYCGTMNDEALPILSHYQHQIFTSFIINHLLLYYVIVSIGLFSIKYNVFITLNLFTYGTVRHVTEHMGQFSFFSIFCPSWKIQPPSPKGGQGCLTSLLSGISGLSFVSLFLSPFFFFLLSSPFALSVL